MKLTYQYKALPTTEQKLELNLWLRICQYWYNRQLGDRFDWWEKNRTAVNSCPLICHLPELRDKPDFYSQKKYLPELKKEPVVVKWSGKELDFSRVPANTLQEVGKRVNRAFERYISGNSKGKRSGKPRFKSESRFHSFIVVGQFFEILGHIAGKAGAVVKAKDPAYSSQLLAYRDEFIFVERELREYWDQIEKLFVDRDVNAAINLKRLGLDMFPSIKRRKGKAVIVNSVTNSTSKEVLHTLRKTTVSGKPTLTRRGV